MAWFFVLIGLILLLCVLCFLAGRDFGRAEGIRWMRRNRR